MCSPELLFSEEEPMFNKKVSIALGNFDGVHIGHQQVVSAAREAGDRLNASTSVLLFEPHPREILNGVRPKKLIPDDLRLLALEKAGAHGFYHIEFEEIMNLEPEEFFYEILVGEIRAEAISCGYNYRFGKKGAGDVNLLKELCEKNNIELYVCEEVDYKNKPVSCTRIRKDVENGNMEDVLKMLGRPFMYNFPVVGGDKRGRLLGAPTINQFFPDDFAVPKNGVYAAAAFVDNKWLPAVANIGLRPTIGTESLRSETCIINFTGDLYGKRVPVGLLKFIRGEQKFESLDELSLQIADDAKEAENYFNGLTGDFDWL